MIPGATPAETSFPGRFNYTGLIKRKRPGRFNYTGLIKRKRPDEGQPLTFQVQGWVWV